VVVGVRQFIPKSVRDAVHGMVTAHAEPAAARRGAAPIEARHRDAATARQLLMAPPKRWVARRWTRRRVLTRDTSDRPGGDGRRASPRGSAELAGRGAGRGARRSKPAARADGRRRASRSRGSSSATSAASISRQSAERVLRRIRAATPARRRPAARESAKILRSPRARSVRSTRRRQAGRAPRYGAALRRRGRRLARAFVEKRCSSRATRACAPTSCCAGCASPPARSAPRHERSWLWFRAPRRGWLVLERVERDRAFAEIRAARRARGGAAREARSRASPPSSPTGACASGSLDARSAGPPTGPCAGSESEVRNRCGSARTSSCVSPAFRIRRRTRIGDAGAQNRARARDAS